MEASRCGSHLWLTGMCMLNMRESMRVRQTERGKQIFHLLNMFESPLSYIWNATTLYLMRNIIYSYTPKVLCWKRFRSDIFAVSNHSLQELHKFFEFMNSIDTSGKIKFTLAVANNNSVLDFLELSLNMN